MSAALDEFADQIQQFFPNARKLPSAPGMLKFDFGTYGGRFSGFGLVADARRGVRVWLRWDFKIFIGLVVRPSEAIRIVKIMMEDPSPP